MTRNKRTIAHWESSGGKHYADLHEDISAELPYSYSSNSGGGVLPHKDRASAMNHMSQLTKAGAGYFHPDEAKTDMQLYPAHVLGTSRAVHPINTSRRHHFGAGLPAGLKATGVGQGLKGYPS